MKPGIAFAATIAAILAVSPVISATAAEKGKLRGEALNKVIAGSTIYLDTPIAKLPIRYSHDGTMTGRSKRLARYTGSVSDQGKWWIRRNRLCQRWQRWLDRRSYCFSLRKRGRKVYWRRSDGMTGTATIKLGTTKAAARPAPLPGRVGLTKATQ